jgi:hypothetical protein
MEDLSMKNYVFWLSSIVLLSMLSGCYTAPPQPPAPEPLALEVQVDKPIYQAGEFIVLSVRANQDCYLALYDISTEGEVTQIFPNKYADDNLISGGHVYRIPNKSDKFDYEVTGPAGIERVRAVCTQRNVNMVETSLKNEQEVFPRIQQASPQFEQSLNQKLETMPSDQWAEASITFQVQ